MQGPKNSSHQLINATMSCPMSARQRACRQPCPDPPGNDDFLNSGNCENSTVSTTTAPGTCKLARQGHRSPCQRTAAGESRWSKGNLHDLRDVDHLVQHLERIYGLTNCLDHERLPCRRPTMDCNCGDSTVCSQKDEDRPQDPNVLPLCRKA